MFQKIVHSSQNVSLNTNIYRHSNFDYVLRGLGKLDLTEDIYVIQGSPYAPISYEQMGPLFSYLDDQMMEIKGNRSYNYEGLEFNTRTNMYEIKWES